MSAPALPKPARTAGLFVLAALATGIAHGAGFQITESSVTGLGRAFAGSGLVGDDLSAIAYNPAGLTLLDGTRIQGGATFISSSGEFRGRSTGTPSLRATGAPIAGPVFSQTSSGGGSEDAGAAAVVPNNYFVHALTPDLRVGFGLHSPFGLETDYGASWTGRYHAQSSELQTLDLNPTLAWRLSPQLSLGFGLSYQLAKGRLSQAVFTGTPVDGFAEFKGDSDAFGWNLGAMYELAPGSRIGLSFRSKMTQDFDGDLRVRTPLGSRRFDAETSITLPETVNLGYVQALDERLSLSFGARWTNWSRFDELKLVSAGLAGGSKTFIEDWRDTWTLSAGVDWRYSEVWTLRAGVAWDQTPVSSEEHRTARIPDADRWWLGFGASYRPTPKLTIDAGFAHLFFEDADTHNVVTLDTASPAIVIADSLTGSYSGSATLFGLQLQYRFD